MCGDAVLIWRGRGGQFRNNFQTNPAETFPNHAELFGSFFAYVDIGATTGDAAVGDADEDSFSIGKTGNKNQRSKRQMIVCGRELTTLSAPMGERILRNVIPNRVTEPVARISPRFGIRIGRSGEQ